MDIGKIRERVLAAPTETIALEFLMVNYILGNVSVEEKQQLKKLIKEEWKK